MAADIDWDAVAPVDNPYVAPATESQPSPSSDQGIDWNSVRPIDQESSDALRQRLQFNLQNDYAPDQGNLYDQAILGVGQGLAPILFVFLWVKSKRN